jgi:hypothetical protein
VTPCPWTIQPGNLRTDMARKPGLRRSRQGCLSGRSGLQLPSLVRVASVRPVVFGLVGGLKRAVFPVVARDAD